MSPLDWFQPIGWTTLAIFGFAPLAQAQIVTDNTLPVNSVVPDICTICPITGGTLASDGQTLFHSFREFSILTGGAALFQNDPSLTTIITRVTGAGLSDIDGAIAAQGGADLFLLNPNGIIFGPNASLAIGGSFIASTADSVQFIDSAIFSAVAPQAPPLLTVSTPVGLQFGSNPGDITNRSQAASLLPPLPFLPGLLPSNTGLEVFPGQTLGLIGGNVSLEGGNLTALQGQVNIGSVSGGTVSLSPTAAGLAVNYDNIQNFGNIQLSEGARITTSGLGGGFIQLNGGQVTLVEDALLTADTFGNLDVRGIEIQANQLRLETGAQIAAFTFGDGAGGDITVNATDSVEFIGEGSLDLVEAVLTGNFNLDLLENGLFAASVLGSGPGGDVLINTENLTLRQGAVIAAGAFFGDAQGGDLTIRATEAIQLDQAILSSGTIGDGNAGQLTIETEQVIVENGGLILSSNDGSGQGGDIEIVAAELIDLSGAVPLITSALPNGELRSGVVSSSRSNAPAGDIRLSSEQLTVLNGATISASSDGGLGAGGAVTINAAESVEVAGRSASGASRSSIFANTTGAGDAGSVTVTTERLSIRDGGQISTFTSGPGMGGDVTVTALETVEIIGSDIGPSTLQTDSRSNGGGAGNVRLITGQLTLQDDGRLSVSSRSMSAGGAGNLEVQADVILLDNDSRIRADNLMGAEGNITLRADTVLFLSQGSQISTNSRSDDGGNIKINTPFLIAVPQQNSDITANAQQGRGGRVSITAQGILGTTFREELTPESDITATSDLGPEFSGVVELNTPELEPDSGLVELPDTVNDPTDQIVAGCPADGNNRFVVVGQGGLPPNPTQRLQASGSWQDWRFLDDVNPGAAAPVEHQYPVAESTTILAAQPIREANYAKVNENGQVMFIAGSAAPSRLGAQQNTSGKCGAASYNSR